MRDFPFVKLFTELRNDAKLRALHRQNPSYPWIWVKLLCYAGEQPAETRGVIDRPFSVIAVEITDGDENLLLSACTAMNLVQLIACDFPEIPGGVTGGVTPVTSPVTRARISFPNFDKWQRYKKPSDAPSKVADRVRKHREDKKKRQASGNPSGCNAVVTPPCNAPVTPCNTQDKEKEEELNTPPAPLGETGVGVGNSGAAEPPAPTLPRPAANHPDDLRRVEDRCRALWPLNGWEQLARAACQDYPPAWVLAAMNASAAAGKNFQYAGGILKRYRAQGGPDAVAAAAKSPPTPAYVTAPPGPAKTYRGRPIPGHSTPKPEGAAS